MKISKILLFFILNFSFLGNVVAGINDGLVAHYPFDGDAYDISGNGYNGVAYGASLTKDRFGNPNSAYSFNGINNYIDLPDMNPDYSQGFTISSWVYFDSYNNWSRIIDLGNGSSNDNIVLANRETSNTLAFNIFDKRIISSNIYIEGLLTEKEWSHIAVTVDSLGNFTIYKGGVSISTGLKRIPNTVNRINNYIGKSNWNPDEYFNGMMDDNRALSEFEIKELYQKTDSTSCTNNPPLIISNNITMLDDNNTLTLLEKAKVFGANGTEIVKIANTPNATIDSNIERIEFSKNLDFYTFALTGNILTVSNTYGVVAKITTSDHLLKLAFKDGSVNFNLTGLDNGVFSEGALTLSNNFDITNIKAILNTNDSSDSTLVNIGSIVSQCAQ